MKMHAPIELEMNVLIINEATSQRGKATIGLGLCIFRSQQEMADRLTEFEESELQNISPGFRLMTKEEAFNYAMFEKTGVHESWAIPGGDEWELISKPLIGWLPISDATYLLDGGMFDVIIEGERHINLLWGTDENLTGWWFTEQDFFTDTNKASHYMPAIKIPEQESLT